MLRSPQFIPTHRAQLSRRQTSVRSALTAPASRSEQPASSAPSPAPHPALPAALPTSSAPGVRPEEAPLPPAQGPSLPSRVLPAPRPLGRQHKQGAGARPSQPAPLPGPSATAGENLLRRRDGGDALRPPRRRPLPRRPCNSLWLRILLKRGVKYPAMAAAGPLAEAAGAHHFPPAAPGRAQRRPCGSEVSRAPAASAPPPRQPTVAME